jgi:hypothetical protein
MVANNVIASPWYYQIWSEGSSNVLDGHGATEPEPLCRGACFLTQAIFYMICIQYLWITLISTVVYFSNIVVLGSLKWKHRTYLYKNIRDQYPLTRHILKRLDILGVCPACIFSRT